MVPEVAPKVLFSVNHCIYLVLEGLSTEPARPQRWCVQSLLTATTSVRGCPWTPSLYHRTPEPAPPGISSQMRSICQSLLVVIRIVPFCTMYSNIVGEANTGLGVPTVASDSTPCAFWLGPHSLCLWGIPAHPALGSEQPLNQLQLLRFLKEETKGREVER